MTEVDCTGDIRRRLPHAWAPFFGRHGRLTATQLKAMPPLLDGKNVVIACPTASGKTEAVVAPVAERCVVEGVEGLVTLYVVPTRALANDMLRRIKGPLADMNLTCRLKHGDCPDLPADDLPNFLITTPESLDSLLCRRTQALSGIRTIVLDEIHLLDSTFRGDQLRVLLQRMRAATGHRPFMTHLLSATLSDADATARRYVESFELVEIPSRRSINYRFAGSVEDALRRARADGWLKVLCFANKRESVEEVAKTVAPIWAPYPVLAHHGSLSRDRREDAERAMQESQVAVCVATSTLEIGIDVGDIDGIVLADPPWSVSSLLQRIGRGNRRTNTTEVLAVASSRDEESMLGAMFVAAAEGRLSVEEYVPQPSVAVQQALSVVYQHIEGIEPSQLAWFLTPLCSDGEARTIVSHLCEKGWLEMERGRVFVSSRLSDFARRGKIHSNIPDSDPHQVVDIDTGRPVGEISGAFDAVFVLAGRAWKVVAVKQKQILVRRFAGDAPPPSFDRCRTDGAFQYLVPPELRVRGRRSVD